MQTLAYQPLGKSYTAGISSRSFCISYFCYLLTIIVPAMILINLQYSWPEFNRVLITPTLQYQGYELTCADSSGQPIYSTNFENVDANVGRDYGNYVSVSVDEKMVRVEGEVYQADLQACSLQLYLFVDLTQAIDSIVQIPLNFQTRSSTKFLSRATIKGIISIESNSPLPQSSILTVNQTAYNNRAINTHQTLHSSFLTSGSRNLTLFLHPSYQNYVNSDTSSASFAFSGSFSIMPQVYHRQANLIEKIRSFLPIFMFLAVIMWKCAINPLVEWMFLNRIYSAKVIHEKVKKE